MKKILFSAAAVIAFAVPSLAQSSGNPDNWCREGLFTKETKTFAAGVVKPARTYFYSDDKDSCPAAASCRTSAYVVKGDSIITNRSYGDYTCGWFTSARGGVTVGWLKTADLAFPEMAHNADEKVWLGEWRYASSTIKLSSEKEPGYLKVTGDSYWQGLGDNIHIGELNGRAQYRDGLLEYSDGESEYDCRATMRLKIEKYLIVADNGNCGGMNVSFSGIYRKVVPKTVKKK